MMETQGRDLVRFAVGGILKAGRAAELPAPPLVVNDDDGIIWSWNWLMRRKALTEEAILAVEADQIGDKHLHITVSEAIRLPEYVEELEQSLASALELLRGQGAELIHPQVTFDEMATMSLDMVDFEEQVSKITQDLHLVLLKSRERLEQNIIALHDAIINANNVNVSLSDLEEIVDVSGETVVRCEGLYESERGCLTDRQ